MSRIHSYLNAAKAILLQYDGKEPFASFLKKYFASNKKHGSKDRRHISHLCYCFFRLGKIDSGLTFEERLLLGLFLCSGEPNEMLEELKPEWIEKVYLSASEKLSIFNAQQSMLNIFPWKDELTDGIDHELFCKSFFTQPDLFLRLRPGNEMPVKEKLREAGIEFDSLSEACLALPNASKIEPIVVLNKEAVVQDYSSQRVGEFFVPVRRGPSDRVWDCCAASGGKSIMLYDYFPLIDLTVSDKRESIIANLKKRFYEAGITRYKSFVADLASSKSELQSLLSGPKFDFILCDAPCTGSGTWSRTPEQLYFFDERKISEYAALQQKIVSNIITYLRPGGHLLYITCSVFKKENEEVVGFMTQQFNLRVVKMELLKGYDKKADTMFAALLQKDSGPSDSYRF